MTTIAYDGKVMAADTLHVSGYTKSYAQKIWFLRPGVIVGAAGPAATAAEVIDWLDRGAHPADFPKVQRGDDWSLVLVVANRRIMRIEQGPIPIMVRGPYAAAGSGAEFALAAMALGKSAYDAVQLAGELDTGTGGAVDVLDPSCKIAAVTASWRGRYLQEALNAG